jgi:hypothetical protein
VRSSSSSRVSGRAAQPLRLAPDRHVRLRHERLVTMSTLLRK